MELYVGAKLIKAEKAPAPRNYGEHKTGEPGYMVEYPDGYTSWSPKDVFEEAYHEADTNFIFNVNKDPNATKTLGEFGFDNAIRLLKKGFKLSRKGWNGKNQYIVVVSCLSYVDQDGKVVNSDHKDMGNAAIAFVGTSGTQVGWLASQADMLAEDWGVYGGK